MACCDSDLDIKRQQLLDFIRPFGSCAVAFSAGVDSTVVAKAAVEALGSKAVAVTGVSPSLAEGELEEARRLARLIGIRHVEIETGELEQADYARNRPDRCYHCKTELFRRIGALRERFRVRVVFSGANADDFDDYRPGNRAADEQHVVSPLARCGLTKDDVRRLARDWELPVWDKPAMPCLASRIAYGQQVTPERLSMVDRAERLLRREGFPVVRVRYHGGDLARVEVPADQIGRLCDNEMRDRLVRHLSELGFKFVTVDLTGFRSGSLNVLVPEDQLKIGGKR